MPDPLYIFIGSVLGGGVLGSIITTVVQSLASRGKNKAEAEVTLGDGWEKFTTRQEGLIQKLEQRVGDVENDNASLRKELRDVSAAYFEQQRTIIKQQDRIAEQDIKISDQQEEINSLKLELEKYKQPVTLTPVTT